MCLGQKSPCSYPGMPVVTQPSVLRNFLTNSRNDFANCLATGVINPLQLALDSHQAQAIKPLSLSSHRRHHRRIMQVRPGKVGGFFHSSQPRLLSIAIP
ncbi:hypothetical protein ACET3X_009235 [Alternaria dauci]|uniref:Uncharacterized protein n=1 Tax=Alternaria dauci TaxID=48095 RepID=A0ABR3U891_9PLEO